MLKALGKLTKSKAIPASKDQITEYKRELQEKEKRHREFSKTDAILKELTSSYAKHKHDLAPLRYEALKEMIEVALTQLRKSETVQVRDIVHGKIGSLLMSAKEFATSGPFEDGTTSVDETGLSSVEVEMQIKALRRETESFKNGYRLRRDILEDMDKKYRDAMRHDPIKRYAEVKLAAKSSIESYEKIVSKIV